MPVPANREDGPKNRAGALALTILVVDDEALIRLTVVEVFRECGAAVLEAGNARQALDLLGRHPEISLLFTDVRMPGMSGIELARQAQEMRPDLRIVLTTGFSQDDLSGFPVIAKPWDARALEALCR